MNNDGLTSQQEIINRLDNLLHPTQAAPVGTPKLLSYLRKRVGIAPKPPAEQPVVEPEPVQQNPIPAPEDSLKKKYPFLYQ